MVEKPWGVERLPAPFDAPAGKRIGEVWFEPPAAMPSLLVKYIFTSEALSVQVHPNDEQAHAAGLGRQGKDECWLVTSAQPGARIGLGFCEDLTSEIVREAALDGSIEALMAWHEVMPGDFFSIPAGTVHAIGAGIGLIEVQQNSDVTYRLYDHGRPRELHLEAAVKVAQTGPYPAALHRRLEGDGALTLIEGPHFRLDRLDGPPGPAVLARYSGPLLVIPLDGDALVTSKRITPGECAWAAGLAELTVNGRCLIAQPCAQAGSVASIQPPPTTRSPA
jgi:mannose-6-phosphate isomerase